MLHNKNTKYILDPNDKSDVINVAMILKQEMEIKELKLALEDYSKFISYKEPSHIAGPDKGLIKDKKLSLNLFELKFDIEDEDERVILSNNVCTFTNFYDGMLKILFSEYHDVYNNIYVLPILMKLVDDKTNIEMLQVNAHNESGDIIYTMNCYNVVMTKYLPTELDYSKGTDSYGYYTWLKSDKIEIHYKCNSLQYVKTIYDRYPKSHFTKDENDLYLNIKEGEYE